uniref:hypothetical protein n=1 Tax=Salmonella sp. s60368 TaxID=3159723 RepID=UPI0039817925
APDLEGQTETHKYKECTRYMLAGLPVAVWIDPIRKHSENKVAALGGELMAVRIRELFPKARVLNVFD